MGIYVGNLVYEVREEEIAEIFQKHGTVREVQIFSDQKATESRCFAFVDMGTDAEEAAAIKMLNDSEWMNLKLIVKKARTRIKGQSVFSTNWLSQNRR